MAGHPEQSSGIWNEIKKTLKRESVLGAAASCAQEANVDTTVDDSAEKVEMTFTASYEIEGDTETKTVLAEGNKDSNTVYWSTSDDNTTKKWVIYEVKQN